MPEEVKHSQVTEAQVELWMANPVTKAALECFEWLRQDTADQAGTGKLVDSGNADMTHAMLHRALGQQDSLATCQDPIGLLDRYVMILHPPPEEDEADGQ